MVLTLFYVYNYSSYTLKVWNYEFLKIENTDPEISTNDTKQILPHNFQKKPDSLIGIINSKDSSVNNKNEIKIAKKLSAAIADTSKNDTTNQIKIAIIGDSQSEGLLKPLNNYCRENGYNFSLAMVWYSATCFNFGYADTVSKVLEKYQPDVVFIVLGLNELLAKDIQKRKKATESFISKLKNFPYFFIGPANYKEDFGINQVFESCAAPKTFYPSKKLNLPRGKDGRHPSKQGYVIWMDSIAHWVENYSFLKLKMKKPEKNYPLPKNKSIHLNAANYRGY